MSGNADSTPFPLQGMTSVGNVIMRRSDYDALLAENQRLREALADAPSQWVDDADLFVKYTAWLRSIGGEPDKVDALLAENQRLRDVEDAARAISRWDANLIRAQCPLFLMSALDLALNEVDRGREALAGDGE